MSNQQADSNMLRILGVRVDTYNMEQCLERIAYWLEHRSAGLRQVVTINPEGIWLAKDDPQLAQIVEQAALVTADGNGVLWAAKQLGKLIPMRVTGIDLMERLCQTAAANKWSIFLLGAQPGVAEQAGTVLQQRYPGLDIAGHAHGYFQGREQQVIEQVRSSGADILFAALGMPQQEKWLYQHGQHLGCAVAMGVGGSFDVISGRVKRAPHLWQKLKLEWLWRLLLNPSRWRRYLIIPQYMLKVRHQATAQQHKKK